VAASSFGGLEDVAVLFYIILTILCTPATALEMKVSSVQESWFQSGSCVGIHTLSSTLDGKSCKTNLQFICSSFS